MVINCSCFIWFENIMGIINTPNEILMLKISFHFSFYISLNLSTISFNLK